MPSNNKETRQFMASGVFVCLLILLMCYLTFIPVPQENKDLIVTILGVLVGGGAVAMPKLFGDGTDKETEDLKNRLIKMELQYKVLKDEYDRITMMLVTRHIIDKDGISRINE